MRTSFVASLPVWILLLWMGAVARAQSAASVRLQDSRLPDWSQPQTLSGGLQAQTATLPSNRIGGHFGGAFHLSRDSTQLPVFLPPSIRPLSPVGCLQDDAGTTCDVCPGDGSQCKIPDNTTSVWEKLEVDGHIRVRHETDFERINRPTRNRERFRARLGFTYKWNDEIQAGIRWTTGDRKITLEPGDRGGSPLSYQDAGDVFDKFEFNLDRIFITYAPHWLPESFITVGKFKPPWRLNPIFSSPVGDLVWDEAAQPEGVAAGYMWEDLLGFDQLHVVLGESVVLELGNQDDASLFFLQVRGEKQLAARWKVASSLTWYNWGNLNPDGNTLISTENNVGNSVTQVGTDTTQIGVTSPGGVPVLDGRPLFVFDSGFNIINPMIVLTCDNDEYSRIDPIQFVYEAFYNDESFDAQRAFGYSIGAQYGPAVNRQSRKQSDWKIYYTWNDVEQESVFSPVAQDDFQLATNFRGHWVGLDVYLWDNLEVRFWLLSTKPIIPITVDGVTSEETQWRFRADLTAYF